MKKIDLHEFETVVVTYTKALEKSYCELGHKSEISRDMKSGFVELAAKLAMEYLKANQQVTKES